MAQRPSVLFAEPDSSFVQMAAMLSPTYADTMGPSSGGRSRWPRFELQPGTTAEGFVAEMHEAYCAGIDPEISFASGRDEFIDAAREADVLVTERMPIDRDLLGILGPRVRFIQQFGEWVPNIDAAAAAEYGIPVATWRRPANRRVAEHAVLLMQALLRDLVVADRSVRRFDLSKSERHEKPTYTNNWAGLTALSSLGSKFIGLIGLGEVGCEVALLLKGFGPRIWYTQRHRNERAEALLGVEFCDLDTLLSTVDIVSLHLPLTKETEGYLSRRELRLLRSTTYLVNVSRGRLVDESALIEALQSGDIAGAAFDTFWDEPLSTTHPLVGMDNVILTPHVGSGAVDAELFRSEFCGPLVNIARVISGQLPFGVVNMPEWPDFERENHLA